MRKKNVGRIVFYVQMVLVNQPKHRVMEVSIKDFNMSIKLGNKGMELDVYDNKGNHLGDLQIGKAKLVWCKGRTTAEKGIRVSREDMIEFFDSKAAKKLVGLNAFLPR